MAVVSRRSLAVVVVLAAVTLLAGVPTAPGAVAATIPDAPTSVTAVPGDESVTVSWEAPADGGYPITSYRVEVWYGTYYPAMPAVPVPADRRSATVSAGVGSNGAGYRAAVYAVNAQGTSAPSFSNEVVPAGVPSAPYALTVTGRWDGAARVSWTPADPHGATPTSYTVTDSPSGARVVLDARTWDAAPPDPDGAGYYWVDLRGLRTGVDHSVTVTATNSAGTGPGATQVFQIEAVDDLLPREGLFPGEELRSANGRYSAEMQEDGNVVVYADDVRPLWHTHTWGSPGTTLELQSDGNLVAYPESGWPSRWDSGTFGNAGARLVMQDDGNLVLYAADGTPLWFTGWDRGAGAAEDTLLARQQLTVGQSLTSRNGRYTLQMQFDGNLVVYGPDRRALWHIGVWGRGGNRLRLQADGNAVVYQFNWLVDWHAGTWGNADVRLVMQDDGNLVLYAANGRALWSSVFGRAR